MMSRYAFASALTGLALMGTVLCPPASAELTGNRYNLTRMYSADVSAAEAYLATSSSFRHRIGQWRKHKRHTPAPIIIDVRTVQEHLDGHPRGAYSIPFPRVRSKPDKLDFIGYDVSADAELTLQLENVGFGAAAPERGIILQVNHFVEYVESVIPDKETPLYLMCKTGYRSVQAANALVQIGKYKNIYNIWHGYAGKPKYAFDKKSGAPVYPAVALDLDNDTQVDSDMEDLDGWANFQGLPTTTRINSRRIDLRFVDLYR